MKIELKLADLNIYDDYIRFEIENSINVNFKYIYIEDVRFDIKEININMNITSISIEKSALYLLNEKSKISVDIEYNNSIRNILLNKDYELNNYIQYFKTIRIKNIDFKKDDLFLEINVDKSLDENFKIYAIIEDRFEERIFLNCKYSNNNGTMVNASLKQDEITFLTNEPKIEFYLLINEKAIKLQQSMINKDIIIFKDNFILNNKIYSVALNEDSLEYKDISNEFGSVKYINCEDNAFRIEIDNRYGVSKFDYNLLVISNNEKEDYIFEDFDNYNDKLIAKLDVNKIKAIIDNDATVIKLWLYNIETGKKISILNQYKESGNTLFYSGRNINGKNIRFKYNVLNELYLSIDEEKNKEQEKSESHFKKLPIVMQIKYLLIVVYSYFIYLISIVFRNSNKYDDIWLIGEMNDTAQDNGYHLFKYIRTTYPEKKCFYLLDKDSVDLKNVEPYGNIIYRTTFKHILYLFLAKKHIGTHDYRQWQFPGYSNLFIRCFKNKLRGEFIQLQHGIMHLRSERGFHYDEVKYYDKMVVCSDKEKRLLNDYFSYSNESLNVTGLARFDNLVDVSMENDRKIITIMPTWRKGIRDKRFARSEYYKKWSEILKNPLLNSILEKNNVTLQFYLHIKLKNFTKLFNIYENEHIKIIEHGDKNVQDILKESNLLITDYSSVSFDFVYMKKPVIFYQFDFYNYLQSYSVLDSDEYLRDRFGFVGKECDEIISQIYKYIRNDFKIENEYLEVSNDYFKFRDFNNCERIYKMIQE